MPTTESPAAARNADLMRQGVGASTPPFSEDPLSPGSGLAARTYPFARTKVAISSVFGDPLDRRTWSGAPYNVSLGLTRAGFDVVGLYPRLSSTRLAAFAAVQSLRGHGVPSSGEAVSRDTMARRFRARFIAKQVAAQAIDCVLHTGTLDLPVAQPIDRAAHFLLCDQTWHLSLRYRLDRNDYTPRGALAYENLESESFARMAHIFTFGKYVRQNLIEHYGISPARVTAVGSGMGNVPPYAGRKNYRDGHLLFVAKHLFRAKGGDLALEAFCRARRHRPDLRMTMVGHALPSAIARNMENVTFLPHVSWASLEELYQSAALLLQPMFNDPWGQVYLEALTTRTPVLGLNRNGLPEITEGGQHGFLVGESDPDLLARAILDAMANPERLARMGTSGQLHVVRNYSWDVVANAIAETIAATLDARASGRQIDAYSPVGEVTAGPLPQPSEVTT